MTNDSTYPGVEAALRQAFQVDIPADRRTAIARRVRTAIGAETARRSTGLPHRRFLLPSRRWVLGLAAAVLVGGTVVGGERLFGQLIAGAPLLEDAWERGTDIGQSVTDGGYTLVLEKAAAGNDRLWVALSVDASADEGAELGRMRVIDANGVVMDGGTGAGTGDIRGTSAMLFGFEVPSGVTPEGPYTLEVTSLTTADGELPGRWTFSFDVPLTSASG